MTDRVFPASKPNPPPAMTGGGNPQAPAGKPQPYNLNRPRPLYRPQPRRAKRRCSGRRFCCLCFIYTLIAVLSLLLLAAITACIFYFLYHPKHPTFSVSSVRISAFKLSTGDPASAAFSHLRSKLHFTVSTKNPNSKISFLYDPFTVVVASSGGLLVGNATIPGFAHVPGNTTIVRGTVASDPTQDLDSESVSALKSDLGKKSGFPLSVQLDTKVEVKMEKLQSKKVGIRVTCDGIRGFPPVRKGSGRKAKTTPALGSTSGAKCKVDLRIKIWKFTF